MAAYLKENAAELSLELVSDIIKEFSSEIPEEEVDQARIMYNGFFVFLADSIIQGEELNTKQMLAWSRKNGEREASTDGDLSEIINRYPPTRVILVDYLLEICERFNLSHSEIVKMTQIINYILDLSISETTLAYERKSAQILKDAQTEAHELAAQIVPIQDGIAILPLYGSIDHERAAHITENVLPKISDNNINWLIIDFSGIVKMDGEVAGHIFNIHYMLELIGIQVIITGIRPTLAQQAVRQGIDFSSIKTCGSVMQAIQAIH